MIENTSWSWQRRIDSYFLFFIIHVKACAIACPHQPPARGDNTVSVVRGGTTTPGATKQLLPPDRVLRESYIFIYIYIYIYARSIKSRLYWTLIFIFRVQFVIYKKKRKRVYFRQLMLLRVYSNRFLHNHTGKVVPRVFPSCWKLLAFDQIQLDAYCAAV